MGFCSVGSPALSSLSEPASVEASVGWLTVDVAVFAARFD